MEVNRGRPGLQLSMIRPSKVHTKSHTPRSRHSWQRNSLFPDNQTPIHVSKPSVVVAECLFKFSVPTGTLTSRHTTFHQTQHNTSPTSAHAVPAASQQAHHWFLGHSSLLRISSRPIPPSGAKTRRPTSSCPSSSATLSPALKSNLD